MGSLDRSEGPAAPCTTFQSSRRRVGDINPGLPLPRRGADAFNRRDLDAFLALCDPEIEFSSRLVEVDGGGPYRGHGGLRSWWRDLLGASPDFSGEIEEVLDLGDVTVARL